MDAPTYPPSQEFELPVIVPQPMTTANSSLRDFLSNPKAEAIARAEAPTIALMTKVPMLAPHLGNMSPRSLITFGALKAADLDRVDARLKAEGVMKEAW